MVYLFAGEDQFSKDAKLEKIKRESFSKQSEAFNFDLLYARDLNLLTLQEALLRLPLEAKSRLILIKQASLLKEPLKKHLVSYIKKPGSKTLLILDFESLNKKDTFLRTISQFSTTFHFKEAPVLDTFKLSRQINNRSISSSLRVLERLLSEGIRAEKIIGGLRYCWENDYLTARERKKRLQLLLNCDLDIKTGRLKPRLALEKLLTKICCL